MSIARTNRPQQVQVLLWAFLLLVATSCGTRQRADERLQTTDDYGRVVEIPAHPHRVVSLSPAVTEIVFALGADSLLVGRTDFCTYPAEARAIPSIGGISNLNVERILSLEPDLVISGSMVSRKATDQMDRMGTPMVCVIEKPRFEALYDNIAVIGRLVGRSREADSLTGQIRQECARLTDEMDNRGERPKVYYVVGFGAGGNFTAGGNTFINDIIHLAGGQNIAEEVQGWNYSLEALVKEDPDYIIVRREDSAAFVGMHPYNQLRAVKEGHVIGIESGTLDLQVPRNIEAIRTLRQRMFPD